MLCKKTQFVGASTDKLSLFHVFSLNFDKNRPKKYLFWWFLTIYDATIWCKMEKLRPKKVCKRCNFSSFFVIFCWFSLIFKKKSLKFSQNCFSGKIFDDFAPWNWVQQFFGSWKTFFSDKINHYLLLGVGNLNFN